MARPKGSVNKANLVKRMNETLNAHSHQILIQMIEQALEGCIQSQKVLVDKFAPNLKAENRKVEFDLQGSTLAEKAESVLAATAEGKINTDHASALLTSINSLLSIKEREALESRIKALEKKIGGK